MAPKKISRRFAARIFFPPDQYWKASYASDNHLVTDEIDDQDASDSFSEGRPVTNTNNQKQ